MISPLQSATEKEDTMKHPAETEAVRLVRAGNARDAVAKKLGVTENAVWAWTYLARPADERSENQERIAREVVARWRRRAAEAGR